MAAAAATTAAYGATTLKLSSAPFGDDAFDVLVKVETPSPGTRCPTDIVCIVDVSGSMGTPVSATDNAEATGLTLMDITKHAVKTVVHTLNEHDRFALVSYSNNATLVMELTEMTEAGKADADQRISSLRPGGQTNLWDGLHTGLECLAASNEPSRCSAAMLLTDGLPNIVPPRGHVPMLQRWKESNPMNCSISTFGFGYNLDSNLLRDIATEGQGMFSFVPDANFVGTCFVNTTSNILATCGRRAVLTVSNNDDEKWGEALQARGVQPCLGNSSTFASWGVQTPIGTLQAGQSKDIILRLPGAAPPSLFVSLDYVPSGATEEVKVTAESAPTDPNDVDVVGAAEACVQRARLAFVEAGQAALRAMEANNDDEAKDVVARVAALIRSDATACADERVQKLLEDVEGQVMEAISRRDWFKKWGKHYLLSLTQAHRLQSCSNFKDPGVQVYGGDLFRGLRDTADTIFLKLPPPVPAVPIHTPSYGAVAGGRGGRGRGRAAAVPAPARRPVDMSMFMNAGAPCFHGNSQVAMEDGSSKACAAVRQGDRVICGGNNGSASARVKCVIKTMCGNSETALVQLPGGLLVTPYHPVQNAEGKWVFPADLAESKAMACEAVYNFILEAPPQHHSMVIDGTVCVTLGHGLEEETVQHPFFGSMERVQEDLQQTKGWGAGLVVMRDSCTLRDPATGLVAAFDVSKEVLH